MGDLSTTGKEDPQDNLLVHYPRFRIAFKYSNSSRALSTLLPIGLEIENKPPSVLRRSIKLFPNVSHLPPIEPLDTIA